MPGLQNIQNGVTTGGIASMALDLSPSVEHFVKSQEAEQERRRRIIQQNDNLLYSTDLSKLSQSDLDGGIKKKYDDFKKLGMGTYKDFSKHDAAIKAAHHALNNDIATAINVRKSNMALYDDLKSLLPPEELIRLQEDIKRPSINPDGTQNILDASKYKLKPKDYLSVNKMVYDAIDRNTNKPENLKEVRRSDGKFNKLTGARINVKNAIDNILEDYRNDHKVRESVDNAVAEYNKQSPSQITPEQYIRNQVEANVVSKQSDRMKELYPDGVFKPGSDIAYTNVNPITPNEWVSHVTVKPYEDRTAKKQVELYNTALDKLGRALVSGKELDNATALTSKVVKGAILEGNTVTGAEVISKNGQRGIKVIYQDPITGKLDPKEYFGAKAIRQLGVLHNSKASSAEAVVSPIQVTKAQELKEKNIARAQQINKSKPTPQKTDTKPKVVTKPKATTQKFKGVPPGGF